MKINIGCGRTYRKGFVNVDAFDKSVADLVMSAHHLEFDDNVAELIECSHVLEHLGAVRSIYAISEFYRVLKPGGALKIATPDIETAFESFKKRDSDDRKYLMNWIYGLDIDGMSHKYGYPEELLRDLLSEVGFVSIRTKQRWIDSNQPELLAICKKPLRTDGFHLVSQYRHKLIEDQVIRIDDQVIGLDQNRIIQRPSQAIVETSPNKILSSRVIIDTCLESPDICLVFVRFLVQNGYAIPAALSEAVELAKSLALPEVLALILEQMPDIPESQDEFLLNTLDLGRKSITKLAKRKQRDSVVTALERTRNQISEPLGLALFSEEAIEQASLRALSTGIQAFAKDDLRGASYLLKRSIHLNRLNLLARWNLARVSYLLNGEAEAISVYDSCFRLVDFQFGIMGDDLRRSLREDVNAIHENNREFLNEPKYELA